MLGLVLDHPRWVQLRAGKLARDESVTDTYVSIYIHACSPKGTLCANRKIRTCTCSDGFKVVTCNALYAIYVYPTVENKHPCSHRTTAPTAYSSASAGGRKVSYHWPPRGCLVHRSQRWVQCWQTRDAGSAHRESAFSEMYIRTYVRTWQAACQHAYVDR